MTWEDLQQRPRVLLHSDTSPGALFNFETALKVCCTSGCRHWSRRTWNSNLCQSRPTLLVTPVLPALSQAWYWSWVSYEFQEKNASKEAVDADGKIAEALEVQQLKQLPLETDLF